MTISDKMVVVLTYELIVDGQTIDKADKDKPLDYIHGEKMLLPKFEEEIAGKSEGEEFDFFISPENGYGEYNPEHLVELPKNCFEIDGQIQEELLKPGNIIPMLNNEDMVVRGTVKEVKQDIVVMDFNHPLAGKTLHFKGNIISIREATEKELKEGLHGEFLPKECCCHGNGEHHHKDGEGCCCHGKGHHEEGEGCCCHNK